MLAQTNIILIEGFMIFLMQINLILNSFLELEGV